jgi:hypothetical protein
MKRRQTDPHQIEMVGFFFTPVLVSNRAFSFLSVQNRTLALLDSKFLSSATERGGHDDSTSGLVSLPPDIDFPLCWFTLGARTDAKYPGAVLRWCETDTSSYENRSKKPLNILLSLFKRREVD